MSYKKYITFLISFIVLFISYHLLVYNLFTNKIFNLPKGYIVGDLGRMSYLVNFSILRKTEVDLNCSHFYMKNFKEQPYDVITLGDSFFNGGGGGKNPYLQDYMVKYTHLKILNILNFNPKQSPIYLIENLIKIGWFDHYKPKYLILESVTRSLTGKFDLNNKYPINTIKEMNQKIISPGYSLFTYVPTIKLINTANYKIPYYNIAYLFNNHAQKDVYKFHLKKQLFSKNKREILFYHEGVEHASAFTHAKVQDINKKLNAISHKLKRIGIKLIFLVAVDKYDLYSPYLKEKNLPKNHFFQNFDEIKKDYIFINTKEILQPYLDYNSSKSLDIFYLDDTHWTYKANDIIAKFIAKKLKK